MEGSPPEVDEFEKYFKKASDRVFKLQGEELVRRGSLPETSKKSNKKSKERRGSSYKQVTLQLGHDTNLISSHKQSRKSIGNPVTDVHSCFLKPAINVSEASSMPNSRSGSFKLSKARSARDIQDELLSVSDNSARRVSLTPEEVAENKLKEIKKLQNENFFVVRSFLTSPKGDIVNRGDSFKKKSSSLNDKKVSVVHKNSDGKERRLSEVVRGHRPSVHSKTSASISDVISANAMATSEEADSIKLQPTSPSDKFQFISRPSIEITRCYFPGETQTLENTEKKVVSTKPTVKRFVSHEPAHVIIVLGDHRVGKTNLVTQFLTSEHLVGLDTSYDSGMESDKTISVSVDGDETLLNFVDTNIKDYGELQHSSRVQECAAYLVVYSITDSNSFNVACGLISQLCHVEEHKKERCKCPRPYAVIVVANKGDLVRQRKVSDSDAREMSSRCGCKFIEVSAGLNHKVDELLVGVVHQVRLNERRRELVTKSTQSKSSSESKPSPQMPNYFGWFKKLFGLKGKAEEWQCDDMLSL